MLLCAYNPLHLLYLCTLSTAVMGLLVCENGAGTSPLLADCYAALSRVPNNDQLVSVPQSSAVRDVAGIFGKTKAPYCKQTSDTQRFLMRAVDSGTCSIKVSDFTLPGMKAIDPSLAIKWDQVRAEINNAISLCATTDAHVITGAVVIIGMWPISTSRNSRIDRNILTQKQHLLK